ncbi:MAG: V-type ATP synthase subunit E family protein [Candidatus Omnitrophica bacterium]|nr:V-type ATP synthase subunit E family protein [Candidatus Omnitrophota bacterium]
MAQEIKDLIAKIQREGVKAAQEQAAQIKAAADSQAKEIISAAKSEAKRIIENANTQAEKLGESTNASLKQAGRDLLISLRKEVNAMLGNLTRAELGRALAAEELAEIIGALIKSAPLSLGSEIIVSLNEKDKEKLEKGFLKHLAQETKKQIILKSSDGIDRGFIISFDAGKSIFDFSDTALIEYITGSLKPELDKILKPG